MLKRNKLLRGLMTLVVVGSALLLYPQLQQSNASAPLVTGHGDVASLKSAFAAWRGNYETKGGSPEVLRLTLGHSVGLSTEMTEGRGKFALNLLDGKVSFQSKGLKDGEYFLWLINDGKQPGNTVKPEHGDRFLQVGTFKVTNGAGELETQLKGADLVGFSLDSVVVTAAGKQPTENLLITGGPDLLQKLYYANQPWAIAELGDFKPANPAQEPAFAFLLPKVAVADIVTDLTPVLGAQVALGRQLFHKETFNGNGRTCGTCHRAENNFTLDPNFIATLSPSDPLFVAETNPTLAGLENPTLMRKYGLILTNVDGPGKDIFRSVPHTLSLATTVVSESQTPVAPFTKGEFAADDAFANATGWSGDGAPGSGSLREFTIGAINQHFPKSLNRVAGTDFRLPSGAELDAIQAYMLALGRSKDYPIYKLTLKDSLAQAGKELFDTKQNGCTNGTAQTVDVGTAEHPHLICPGSETVVQGETANCNGCHQHAGGRSSTTFANPTRNTGVENFKINSARLAKPDLAYDGGFGQTATYCGTSGADCYGDGRFNTPPLIEAADTAPFFHNNVVTTLEEAIASYNSDAFNQSPGALTAKLADRKVKLDSTQVVAVASFLRAVNALENIRLSNRLDNQARGVAVNTSAKELVKLASEELQDAIRVLKEGVFVNFGPAVTKLEQAAYYENLAQLAANQTSRNTALQQSITAKLQAWSLIASCDNNAARPATVGSSPSGFVYSCSELTAF